MAVEIAILSGARQGVTLGFESTEFRAGSRPECEIYFDPLSDPGAKDRAASFRLQDDGWYVRRTGGGAVFVNHEAVQGATRLRSGDVVRMSERGPDFSFTIVKQLSAAATTGAAAEGRAVSGPGAAVPTALPHADRLPSGALRPPSGAVGLDPPLRTPAIAAGAPTDPVLASAGEAWPLPPSGAASPPLAGLPVAEPARRGGGPWGRAFWASIGVVLGALLFVGVWRIARAPEADPSTVAATPRADSPQPTTPVGPQPPTVAPPAVQPAPVAPVTATPAAQPKVDDQAARLAGLKETIYFIQAELPLENAVALWPLATACAIHGDTLLTSATAAIDVARLMQQGFKIRAVQPERDFRLEVREVRLHAAYARLYNDRRERRFFDLAVLVVQPQAPKTLPLAAAADLKDLDEGARVSVLGYSFPQVKKLTRHDRFEVQVTPAEIFLVKSPPPHAADGPRSLDLTAALPPNSFGGAVVGPQGQLAAVYVELPSEQEAQAIKNLHYATLANAQYLQAWIRDRDTKQWIVPKISEKPPTAGKP